MKYFLDNIDMITKRFHIIEKIPVGDVPHVRTKHVAIMLLSIMDLVSSGVIESRKVFFAKDLLESYLKYWKSKPKITAGSAFIQMGQSEFFSLFLKNPIKKFNIAWNESNVSRYVHYGSLHPDLYELLRDSKLRCLIYDYLNVRFIEEISRNSILAARTTSDTNTEADCQKQIEKYCNVENFKSYLSTIKSFNGVFYDKGKINLYSSAVSNDYLSKKLKKIGFSSIYDITSYPLLFYIENLVSYDFGKGKTTVHALYGVRQYIRFISALNRFNDK